MKQTKAFYAVSCALLLGLSTIPVPINAAAKDSILHRALEHTKKALQKIAYSRIGPALLISCGCAMLPYNAVRSLNAYRRSNEQLTSEMNKLSERPEVRQFMNTGGAYLTNWLENKCITQDFSSKFALHTCIPVALGLLWLDAINRHKDKSFPELLKQYFPNSAEALKEHLHKEVMSSVSSMGIPVDK